MQADQQTKDQDSSSHQAAELHRTQDADASRSAAVTSLAQHLQAATLAQHLHMSDLRAQQQQNPFTALPDTHDTIHAAGTWLERSSSLEQLSCQPRPHRTSHSFAWGGTVCCCLLASVDAASPHTELLGTNQHLLGVTAQQLRQLSFPSRKAAQVCRSEGSIQSCEFASSGTWTQQHRRHCQQQQQRQAGGSSDVSFWPDVQGMGARGSKL